MKSRLSKRKKETKKKNKKNNQLKTIKWHPILHITYTQYFNEYNFRSEVNFKNEIQIKRESRIKMHYFHACAIYTQHFGWLLGWTDDCIYFVLVFNDQRTKCTNDVEWKMEEKKRDDINTQFKSLYLCSFVAFCVWWNGFNSVPCLNTKQ